MRKNYKNINTKKHNFNLPLLVKPDKLQKVRRRLSFVPILESDWATNRHIH